MTTTAAPKDKLDAAAGTRTATAAPGRATANGPEGDPGAGFWDGLDWERVDWDSAEGNVRRLRQRIFTASQQGDLARVRNLQKLMLRSLSNTLVGVRRVTQVNKGRATPGVDGQVVLTGPGKVALARFCQERDRPWQARPVRRVFIPKNGSNKRRPLGIPVIVDRVHQARATNALEPQWEAVFEPRSYGFRPGRSTHDAIGAIYNTLKGPLAKRVWVLDADLKAAFDRIDHDHLMRSLGSFPARGKVREWLKAGVIEKGRFSPTEEGVPQGGVISPVLLNVALHGMETAAGVRYLTGRRASETTSDSPVLIRYADDALVLCHSRHDAEQIKERLADWLEPRGLEFNEDKTRIVHVESGFDFLGFTIRRRHGKVLITPSKTAVDRMRRRLSQEMRALRGAPPLGILRTLNPIVRGWSAYYRGVISAKAFNALDHHLWRLTYLWALRRHPKKSKHWVVDRYFGRFHPRRADRWVFGDRDTGAWLTKFAWTPTVRHEPVKGTASPDDPALIEYWARRRRKNPPPTLGGQALRLLREQKGRCPSCGQLLLHADQAPQSPTGWEQWTRAIWRALTKNSLTITGTARPDGTAIRITHKTCARKTTSVDADGLA